MGFPAWLPNTAILTSPLIRPAPTVDIPRIRRGNRTAIQHLRTVVVAPMNSKGFAAPFRVDVTHAGTRGLIVLDQIRTVDKIRLVKRSGRATAKTLSLVFVTLQQVSAE